ncbi:HPP family protein, partial [Odoribacter splanchnicus]|nr:HPP family protein [Odoribacter splanchnicus]
AALIIGMGIVDKRVWHIEAGQKLSFMTLGACTGVLLVLYSSFPLVVYVEIAFLFAGLSLLLTRTTLFI